MSRLREGVTMETVSRLSTISSGILLMAATVYGHLHVNIHNPKMPWQILNGV